MRNLTVFEKTTMYNDTERWVFHYLKTPQQSLNQQASLSHTLTQDSSLKLPTAPIVKGDQMSEKLSHK